MTERVSPAYAHPLRLADLASRKPTRFALRPDAAALADLARDVDATALKRIELKGELRPAGRHDWLLEARLTGTAEQPCVVTLAPVRTRIDAAVRRSYLADWQPPAETEAEMPDDDSTEPLPAVIDLGAVLAEALTLALPDYPRAPGVDLGAVSAAPPGAAPLTDAVLRPFAGLAALQSRLAGGGAEDEPAPDAGDGTGDTT